MDPIRQMQQQQQQQQQQQVQRDQQRQFQEDMRRNQQAQNDAFRRQMEQAAQSQRNVNQSYAGAGRGSLLGTLIKLALLAVFAAILYYLLWGDPQLWASFCTSVDQPIC